MKNFKKCISILLACVMTLSLFVALPITSDATITSPTSIRNTTGDLVWEYDEVSKTLTFSGQGKMAEYETYEDIPWYSYGNEIRYVVIGSGVEKLDRFAFYSCNLVYSFTVDENNQYYSAFKDHLFTKDRKELVRFAGRTSNFSGFWDGVDKIGDYAFAKFISSYIDIPETVTELGEGIFYNSEGLHSIDFSTSIKEIPNRCFYGCKYLTFKSIRNLSSELEKIGEYAFFNCTGLTEFVIPDSVTDIGKGAFRNCDGLSQITIPDRVESIPAYCFYNCDKLTTVYISSNIKYIQPYSFYDSYLKELIVKKSDNNGENYTTESNTITIPGSVKTISNDVFYSTFVRNLVVEEGVEEIGNNAFNDCIYLSNVSIPKNLTNIGVSAFYGTNISNLVIEEGVKVIGYNAFKDCTNLSNVSLPESLDYIGASAFENTALKNKTELWDNGILYVDNYILMSDKTIQGEIEIKENTVGIASSVFSGHSKITKVTLPDTVRFLGENQFNNCTEVEEYIVDDNNNWYCSVDGVLYNKPQTELIKYPAKKTDITEFSIPNTVNRIREYAFYNAEALTNIEIPESVNELNTCSFAYCKGLVSIIIPDSIKEIPPCAFDICSNLEYVKLPSQLTSIGYCAFNGSGLKEIDFPETLTTISWWAFGGCNNLVSVIIPDSVTTFESQVFYKCNNLESVTLGKGIKNISNRAFTECTSLKNVTVKGDIKTIYEYAFYKCSSLENISIPNTVVTVGKSAFYNCGSLKDFTIPSTVVAIEDYAFYGASNITLNSPDKLKTIGYSGFYKSVNTTVKNLGNNIRSIGEYAFAYSDIDSITIPDSLTSLGEKTFYKCTKLRKINFGSGITKIPEKLCYGCSSLESLVIPRPYTYINYQAFANCSSMKFVKFLGVLCKYDPDAFKNCTSLSDFYYSGSETQWNGLRNTENGVKVHYNYVEREPIIPTLVNDSVSLKSGNCSQITVNNLGANKITYISTNPKVTSVDKKGKVTALKKGTADITVTVGAEKLTYKVTVTSNPILSSNVITVKKGKSTTVKISGKASGVNNSYTNTKFAKITSKNTATTLIIKGIKKGKTTLKIKVNGVVLKLKVKVK